MARAPERRTRCVWTSRRPGTVGQRSLGLVAFGLSGGQSGDEGFLRDFHPADRLHPLLALLLPLQQLALAADVTAIALGEDVLAQRPDVLAGDDARAAGRLHRHLEPLARDELLEPGGHGQARTPGRV